MRTTVAIDDNLLTAAKRRAHERGISLGALIEDALRGELAHKQPIEAPTVPVFRGGRGPLPGIDLRSNRSLSEHLDRDAAAAAVH